MSPGSGTTATSFTFSVVYRSNGGCAPTTVQVSVGGVGTFSMSGSGTNYTAGVTFRRTMQLPAGVRTYSYRASGGAKSGTDSATLTSVSPSSVTVVSPTATPAPPTPPPTPRPPVPTATPLPTPAATTAPTPTKAPPSPAPAASDGSPAVAPTPTPASSLLESVGPIPSTGGAGAPGPAGQPGGGDAPGPEGAPAFGGLSLEYPGLLIWLVATAGGLGLFMALSRPARQFEPWPQAAASLSSQEPGNPAADIMLMPQAAGEGKLPRWLRPSVQAARHAEPGRERRRSDK